MIKLPSYQRGVVIGLLLSDGWLILSNSRSKNARLGLKQALANSAYVWFVFNILSHYCSSCPRLTTGVRAGNRVLGLEFYDEVSSPSLFYKITFSLLR